MKHPDDTVTQELPLNRKRGRPSTGQALSAAERKRAQRRRDTSRDVENMSMEALMHWSAAAVRDGMESVLAIYANEMLRRCRENAGKKSVTVTK